MEGVDVKVNLDGERINNYVAQAVLDSAIGKQLENEINKKVQDYTGGIIRNQLDHLINNIIRNEAETIVKEKIGVAVRNYLEKSLTPEWIQSKVEEALQKVTIRY